MPRGKPLHVKIVRSKGRRYCYFETGAVKDGKPVLTRLPDIGSPEFGGEYVQAMAARNRRKSPTHQMTVTRLTELYTASPKWHRLASNTRRIYSFYLDALREALPTAPANEVEPRDIAELVDSMVDRPGAANMVVSVTNALYRWGRSRQHVANDPARDIELHQLGEHKAWPMDLLKAALASDDDRVRLATHLLYYTGQRIGDVCRMRWNDIEDGHITVSPQKLRRAEKEIVTLHVPIHRALRAELDQTRKLGMTILTNSYGRALQPERVRLALKAFCAERGHQRVPHGLRKNAVIALLEAGCSHKEAGSMTGQTDATVSYYARQLDQKKMAGGAVLKWERT